MKKFSYTEYLKYQEYIENISYFKNILRESSESYKYNQKEIYHKHDKIFREILEDKKEVASFINKVLKIENKQEALTERDIEKYERKFITNSFKYAETDIIYRRKGQDIFFLIEHQSTIDYSMPYRILMYSLEIMRSNIDEKLLKRKNYQLPMVYPIVIYTGSKKWDVEKYIENKQQKIPGCEPVRFYEYNVIDVNKYTENELLKDEMFLPKLMLLEKAKTSEKMIENLNKIIKEDLTEENKNFLRRMIYYIFRKNIGEKESQKLLKKLQIKERGESMIEELLWQGFKEIQERAKKEVEQEARESGHNRGMKEGLEEGKKEGLKIAQQELQNQWISKMIKSNISDKKILEITEISKKELEKIKKQVQEKAS